MSARYMEELKSKKKKLKVLILGAYSPKVYEDKLFELKNCLFQDYYRSARLVKDFPDRPPFDARIYSHIVMKSKYHIKFWADVLLFVFFKNANNEGVSVEVEFACSKVLEKLGFSVVLSEKDLRLSSMILGDIENQEIRADSFADDQELCKKAIGYLTNFTRRLYYYLP